MIGRIGASETISFNCHLGHRRKLRFREGEGLVQVTQQITGRAEGQNFCLTGPKGNLRYPSLALLFVIPWEGLSG